VLKFDRAGLALGIPWGWGNWGSVAYLTFVPHVAIVPHSKVSCKRASLGCPRCPGVINARISYANAQTALQQAMGTLLDFRNIHIQ
jgi:nitrate/nitrite transporter NarK